MKNLFILCIYELISFEDIFAQIKILHFFHKKGEEKEKKEDCKF